MGKKYKHWKPLSTRNPDSFQSLKEIILENRKFQAVDKLDFGDHGILAISEQIFKAVKDRKRIALYADYDVDGTLSCVSWIWFLKEIGYENFFYYIPSRLKEGYGVNIDAIKYLIHEGKADIIITMDTGITACKEAEYAASQGTVFICTDHHQIIEEQKPPGYVLNPKMHPDPLYQDLCGCGITFVLLRKLGMFFQEQISADLWTDLLALASVATICDVVPLNGVNHKLSKMGFSAIINSKRSIFQSLIKSAGVLKNFIDEGDIGYRIGPRINAVGRLDHAEKVISAFLSEDPEMFMRHMEDCNEKRKDIQSQIYEDARREAEKNLDAPILFLGGNWHPGVLGIAASKIAEEYLRPTWLFYEDGEYCRGSARSVEEFNITEAMTTIKDRFIKFGGHKGAAGFTFEKREKDVIYDELTKYAIKYKRENPSFGEGSITYDVELKEELINLELLNTLRGLKPFGHGFEEPRFLIKGEVLETRIFNDKETGKPQHTAIFVKNGHNSPKKIMFFNHVIPEKNHKKTGSFIVSVSSNIYQGRVDLTIKGQDYNWES